MQQEQVGIPNIELDREISLPGDVCFDPETLSLHGFYKDQLSAYRARKIWLDTLESCFLLDQGHDYNISVISDLATETFSLKCEFQTACARYAFWRLTTHQAPEAQYLIETAHLPDCDSHRDDMVAASDLRSLLEEDGQLTLPPRTRKDSFASTLRSALRRMFAR